MPLVYTRAQLRLAGPSTWVSYVEGGGLWGFVAVKVWGDGRAYVKWGPPAKPWEAERTLTEAELANFKWVLAVESLRLEEPAGRNGVPDESSLVFGSDLNDGAFQGWSRDVPSLPAVGALQKAFLDIGDKVSGTTLPR
jgi:hypothetical protein